MHGLILAENLSAQNQLPRMPILRDVYHNLQSLLPDDS